MTASVTRPLGALGGGGKAAGGTMAPEWEGVPRRSAALDAVKGLLVLLMVLYHWLNYFVTSDGSVYRYLRFITPSFIFVSGFLITNAHLVRWPANRREVSTRLLVRGVKLLALFTVLNVGANLLLQSNYDGSRLGLDRFASKAFAVYVTGDGRGAAFEVLVPIGYLLVASSALLWGCALHRRFLLGAWLVCAGTVCILRAQGAGSFNAELVTMGLLGMVVGEQSLVAVNRATRRVWLWGGMYAVYVLTVSAFDVPFELQIVGLILNLALLYLVAIRIGAEGRMAETIIVLGQYSLLAYIVHIAVLQVLARSMRVWTWADHGTVLPLAVTVALTVLAVNAARWARARSHLLDRLYRMMFA